MALTGERLLVEPIRAACAQSVSNASIGFAALPEVRTCLLDVSMPDEREEPFHGSVHSPTCGVWRGVYSTGDIGSMLEAGLAGISQPLGGRHGKSVRSTPKCEYSHDGAPRRFGVCRRAIARFANCDLRFALYKVIVDLTVDNDRRRDPFDYPWCT